MCCNIASIWPLYWDEEKEKEEHDGNDTAKKWNDQCVSSSQLGVMAFKLFYSLFAVAFWEMLGIEVYDLLFEGKDLLPLDEFFSLKVRK